MKQKMHRLLSLLLCLVMVLGLMPTTALAEGKIPITEFSGSITLPAPVYGETISDNRPTVSTSAHVRFYNLNWQKKIYSDVDAWNYVNSGVFTEGTWRYVLRVAPNDDNYVLDPSLAVTINGEQWKVKYDSKYNWFQIISPEFTVSAPTGGPLQFVAETNVSISDYQVGDTVNKDLTKYTAGGTPPYTYSKVSGPEWLNVSADGKITGTANEIQGSSTLKVKVTDAKGESVTAAISVGCVTLKDGDRIPITKISGNIYLPDPVYGENIRDNLPTVYTSDRVRFYNHHWQKKKYSDVDAWNYVNSGVFTEGTWRYIMQVNADDNYVLTDPLTVTINGEQWKVEHDSKNNFFHIISPEFTVTAPPTLEGTATLSSAYYNSPVNPELSSDLQTLRGQGKLKFNWQRSANGTSGWTNISGATNAVYNPAENDVGKYIRLVITADGYTSSVISNAVEVKQALINFEKPVMPTLSYDGTNGLVVMNAKANQEYLVTYNSNTPSDWSSAKKPSADGSLALSASQNTTVYVHTRVAETTYKPAGMYTDYNSIYTGTPTSLVDFSINYSKLSLKVGEVVKLTATPIPAGATGWTGVQWYSNDASAKLYKDEACTQEYSRSTDGFAKSVYIKGISQKNWFTVGGEKTIGGIPTSRLITVAVTDTEGNYVLERLAFPDVTLAPGESVIVDIASYPNPSKVLGTMTFVANAANPASTLVLTPLENNTKLKIEVPAGANLGGYGYNVKLDGSPITTNVWTVTVAEKGIPVDAVTVVPSTTTMAPGTSMTPTAVVSPSNHTETGSVVWSKVSGSDSITIDPATGKVTVSGSAVDGDTATIRATFGGKYGECVITVSIVQYGVTVTNGMAYIGAGTMITKAVEGTEVILIANAAPSGKVFDKWVVESGDITLADASSATTTFTMPAGAVSVKATYKAAPHTHTFDQEIIKNVALKTPADCTNDAVYYKSCSCGEISTDDAATFTAIGSALGHAWPEEGSWSKDADNHWYECSRCHDQQDKAAHDFGEDDICDTCNYDKSAPHTHNLTLVPATPATCTTPGNKAYYTCDGCDKWFKDAFGSVEITDKTSVILTANGHTPSGWKSDADNHWKECTVVGCGVIIEDSKAAHTAGEWIIDTAATATTDGTKHKECTECGYVMETGTIPATGSGEHTHSYGSDWKSNADKHWHECSCGAKAEEAAHTASDWITDTAATAATDGTKHKECTECGYVMETGTIPATGSGEHTHSYGSDWKSNADKHWHECSCGAKAEEAAHTASDWITDTAATAATDGTKHKECTVCHRVLETGTIPATGSGEHTHSYSSDWKSDSINHWHECSCGVKDDVAAHSFKWVVDKEATATKKGSKHEECKFCGYQRPAVEIPATGSTTKPTDPTESNPNTGALDDVPQTGDNSNMILWIVLLLASGLGVTGTVVYSKRKKYAK